MDNCGTNKFLKILVDSETVVNGLIGRTMKSGQVITSSAGIMDKEIEIYSPVYCRSLKLCKTCVSKYFVERLRSTNIGILSAQTLGERGTQLTMRTFHTGGAASIQSFKDSDPRLDSVIIQEQNDVKAKTDLVITVNVEDIVSNDGDEIVTSSFKIYLEDNDEEIVLDLDYNFTLFINDKENYRMNEEEVTIEVDTETIFGSMKSSTVDMVGAITLILKLLNNKTMSPEKLVRNIFDTYASNTAMPMLPIEVMVSQMLRDPVRPMYPYRLSNYSAPAMRVGIKQIPSVENWKRGAAFENIGSAIRGSILNKTGISHSHSDLDELLKM